ncbi:unnamed protein product [Oikopleura dioica]|uniref:Uncharacterized protein n=1 Tax=Oikopleura dioica TaxID=34765 RepID=E4YU40_OIKDI|nr:unnamed protein product [Oikopleura dioica]
MQSISISCKSVHCRTISVFLTFYSYRVSYLLFENLDRASFAEFPHLSTSVNKDIGAFSCVNAFFSAIQVFVSKLDGIEGSTEVGKRT